MMLKLIDGSTVMTNNGASMSRSRKITSSFLQKEHEYNTDDNGSSGPPWHPAAIIFLWNTEKDTCYWITTLNSMIELTFCHIYTA